MTATMATKGAGVEGGTVITATTRDGTVMSVAKAATVTLVTKSATATMDTKGGTVTTGAIGTAVGHQIATEGRNSNSRYSASLNLATYHVDR